MTPSKLLARCFVFFFCVMSSGCFEQGFSSNFQSSLNNFTTSTIRYVVQRGDTLYSVAFRYDLDYRQVAAYNRLYAPYALKVGQVIYLRVPLASRLSFKNLKHSFSSSGYTKTTAQSNPVRPQATVAPAPTLYRAPRYTGWYWPLKGQVVTGFSPSQGKKGINIAAPNGSKVKATRSGVVAYSGSGLSGYGNLIIIKHDNQYLTAYGFNAHNWVREGQYVKAGQVIADVGRMDRNHYGVHFEIRQWGRPINPIYKLPRPE